MSDAMTLEQAIHCYTTPFEDDEWHPHDCEIRYHGDVVIITYPDKSETVLVRKHGNWVTEEECRPVGGGAPEFGP
jgi:hypothetical protein